MSLYLDGWAYPYLAKASLTNTSSPAATLFNNNIDGTKLMSKPITNMAVTGGLASFDFMGGTPSGICSQQPSASSSHPSVLYRMGDIYIIRNAQGKIVKVNTANSILKLQ